MGMKTKKAIMEIRLEIPQEIKNRTNFSSGTYPEDFTPT